MKSRTLSVLTGVLLLSQATHVRAAPATDRFFVPESLSPASKATLGPLYEALSKTGPIRPPVTLAEYDAVNRAVQDATKPANDEGVRSLKVVIVKDRIASVPVLRVRPANLDASLAPLVYIHGGGWVAGSADSTTLLPALVGTATRREVISIDYTLAPRADFNRATDEVTAVWKALLTQGKAAGAMAMFGDSAGGNLTLTSALKFRDQGLPLPGALYVLSPAADLTWSGESVRTLGDVDPILSPTIIPWLNAAYIGKGDPKSPYASPIYGDYAKAFPPTLIQAGTRELLLSDSVREYQAIRAGGKEALLDIYEGMPHVFQGAAYRLPEARVAIERAKAFLEGHLAPR